MITSVILVILVKIYESDLHGFGGICIVEVILFSSVGNCQEGDPCINNNNERASMSSLHSVYKEAYFHTKICHFRGIRAID